MLLAMLTACSSSTSDGGGGDADGGADVATDADAGGDGGGDAGGESTASITVTLTGGPHEGTYEAEAPDAGCSRNLTGENTFGLQYSTGGTEGFNSHQLIINDASGAASGSLDFVTDVTIDDATYGIAPGTTVGDEARGSGTVTLDDRGDTATITIEGKTAEGYGLVATIECHSVIG